MKVDQKMAALLNEYKKQTRQTLYSFGPSYGQIYDNISAPVLMNPYGNDLFLKHDTGVGTANDVDVWGASGGLFADACLDNPVMSLLSRPLRGVGSLIPVRPDNNEIVKRAFLTGNYDVDGSRPDGVCEVGPNVGSTSAVFAEYRKGRLSFSTRTAELDELIKNACLGINMNRFYFINSVRGVSGPATPMNQDMRSEIFRAALLRELHMVASRLNMDLMKQFWAGDPANNSANGGYKEFVGLLDMIVDDYNVAKAWVTGSGTKTELNSDVKTFGACLGTANADGYSINDLMSELVFELTSRADAYGVAVDWVVVMPRVIWHKLTEILPCEMLSQGCSSNTGVQVVSNDMAQVTLRNEMRRNFTLDVNGMTFPVVLDDFVPVVETVDGVTGEAKYTSDIIFLPLRVNGEPVLEWVHADYRGFEQQLSGLPVDLTTELRGWSDDGRNHMIIQRDVRCFVADVKTEFGLVFTAPMLAGRITSVDACMAQAHKVLNLEA